MSGISDVFSNRWWRWSEYEVRDLALRPAPGAKLADYNVWAEYDTLISQGGTERLYLELFDLVGRIISDERNPAWQHGHLHPDNNEALCKWAAAHGLLGLPLQDTLQVILAARWRKPYGIGADQEGVMPPLIASQSGFARTPAGWAGITDAFQYEGVREYSPTSEDGSLVDTPVPSGLVPASWPKPMATIQTDDFSIVQEPLHRNWGDFFPEVAARDKDAFDYPIPLGDEFWAQYGEPVARFLFAARGLAEATRAVARLSQLSFEEAKSLESWEGTAINGAVERLEHLAGAIAPSLQRTDDGALILAWTGPSLLGLMAMMVLMDLTGRIRLRRCEECQSLFVSGAPAAKYCSEQCRWRKQKRGQRSR